MKNALNWFEIFVSELDRAAAFYERSLGLKLKREVFTGQAMAVFMTEDPAVGGALVHNPMRKPSNDGTVVYLNVSGKIDEVLGRVPAAGGSIAMPKTDIGEPGFIALIRDTEGNTVGLHSPR
ncbi:MAG: hypothetical protein RJA70_1885 [Pseudomonadota bacterium]|jgi:predicted enzyme related to lactoylglutathione lyase